MANKGKRMLFEDEYNYLTELKENHSDPSASWGGGSGGSDIQAGTGIEITGTDTKTISLDTTPTTFEMSASTGTTIEVENQNPLYKDAKLQMTNAGSTRLEGATVSLEGNNVYLNSDNAPYYVNNISHEYKTLATTDQIPDEVSGTNDGTNWTSLTIGNDTYGLASGGSTYTAGTGINIDEDNEITAKLGTNLTFDRRGNITTTWNVLAMDDQGKLNTALGTNNSNGYAIYTTYGGQTHESRFSYSRVQVGTEGYAAQYEADGINYYLDQFYSDYPQITINAGQVNTITKINLPYNTTQGTTVTYTLATTDDIPTVPTNVSAFTNDAGYITSITSSDVTTALGYTPGTSNFSGDYNDLTNKPTIPTVNDPTITFTQGGVTKGTITLNQASNQTIALDAGSAPSNMVTTDTAQTITARKTIVGSTAGLYVQSGSSYTASDTMILPGEINTNMIIGTLVSSNEFAVPDVTTAGNGQIRIRDFTQAPFVDYRITVPTKTGTMALTSDIPTVTNSITSGSTDAVTSGAVYNAIGDIESLLAAI